MSIEKSEGFELRKEPKKEEKNIRTFYADEEWYQLLDAEDQLQIDHRINDFRIAWEKFQKSKVKPKERFTRGIDAGRVQTLPSPLEPVSEEYGAFIRERAVLESKLLRIQGILTDLDLTSEQKFGKLDEIYRNPSFRRQFELVDAIFEGIKHTAGEENFEKWREKMWNELG